MLIIVGVLTTARKTTPPKKKPPNDTDNQSSRDERKLLFPKIGFEFDINPGNFKTAKDAREDFARRLAKESYRRSQEFGATIYSYKNSKGEVWYTYNLVRIGTKSSGTFSPQEESELPKGSNMECVIHTHAGFNYIRDYSVLDKKASNKMGVDWYLLLDSGVIIEPYKSGTWSEFDRVPNDIWYE